MRERTYRLDPVAVTVRADHPAVHRHLAEFYPPAAPLGTGDWVVEAAVGMPEAGMTVNHRGVGHRVDAATGRLRLRGPDPVGLAATARTTVREPLVDHFERRRYGMLHAAAAVAEHRLVVIVGDRGSGKTTLVLKLLREHGMRLVSNDHLVLLPRPAGVEAGLVLTGLPAPVSVRAGTYLDLADRLPPPLDREALDWEGLDLAGLRALPRQQRYALGHRVVYTFPRLGQPTPATVELDGAGPEVLVVLAGYAADAELERPQPVPDPVAALVPNVRADWRHDRRLNPRCLPRTERPPDAYARDTRGLLAALVARATVRRWAHHGDPLPLLRYSGGAAGVPATPPAGP